ncbi:MAG TPA: HAD-IIB family hydrolase [Enterococcus sp.]|nr:HAD-IIB family hydrolase [Enterococcus sp.]HPR81950.1 HAD-IIB family hydrolase [Enterococcus sp.]
MNIVFSDVDGTFQDFGQAIPPINLAAVRALHDQGDHFVFVTGRGYELAQELLTTTNLPCDIIFGNGAGIKLENEEPQLGNCLDHQVCLELLSRLESENTFYFIHTDQGVFVNTITRYHKHFEDLHDKFEAELGTIGAEIMDYKEVYFTKECHNVLSVPAFIQEHPELNIIKIELMEADDLQKESLRDKLAIEDAYIFESYQQTLEVVNPLATKGAAILSYLKNFPKAKSYGFGDGENDVPMFEVVDVSIAMANANTDVKAVCMEQAGECAAGGLGTYIFDHLIQK